MSRADYDDPLYRECLPTRPTAPDPYRMDDGPTAQFARLQGEREKWELLLLFGANDDLEADAAHVA